MNKLLVSIVMITYNHENFIKKAIEGVFLQKANFDIELIIANDCSTDDTDKIARKSLTSPPINVRVNYTMHKINLGMMPNFIWALKQCKGKYIALCEGDDYWTDPYKLQKQVDFLESKEDYSLCFHNAHILCENKLTLFNKYKKESYAIEDIFDEWLIPTASILYRNNSNLNYELLKQATHGDMALIIQIGQYGNFGLLDEIMSVYRKHENGIMNTFKGINFNLEQIRFWQRLNVEYHYKYDKKIKKRCSNLYNEIASEYASIDTLVSLKYLLKSFQNGLFSINIITFLRTFLKIAILIPTAYNKQQ